MAREEIDYEGGDPPYVQLAAILRARIGRGEIARRMPSDRSLTQEFGVAVNTARKAVRMLRDEGLIRTVPGWGSTVIAAGDRGD